MKGYLHGVQVVCRAMHAVIAVPANGVPGEVPVVFVQHRRKIKLLPSHKKTHRRLNLILHNARPSPKKVPVAAGIPVREGIAGSTEAKCIRLSKHT